MWIEFTALTDGVINFTLSSENFEDDIDFVVFEKTEGIGRCQNLDELRCMLSGVTGGIDPELSIPCQGTTGLSICDEDLSENAGCSQGDNNYLRYLNCARDLTYGILIMGFDVTAPVTLDFCGDVLLKCDSNPNPSSCNLCDNILVNNALSNASIDFESKEILICEPSSELFINTEAACGISSFFDMSGIEFVSLALQLTDGCFFADTLLVRRISANDDYFDNGTNSIQITEIIGNDFFHPDSNLVISILNSTFSEEIEIANDEILIPESPLYNEIIYELCDEYCSIECSTASIIIQADEFFDDIKLTNVITPNNDGSNDLLRFNENSSIEGLTLTIFNRWGDKIFRMEDYDNSWDASGYSGGIYFYVLEYRGEVIKKTLTVAK